MVNRGYREFVIDLQNCAMMDSTFMGTMAGVALRLRELGHGHLRVVHCGNRSRDLLSGLGLDQIISIQANGSNAPDCESLGKDAGEAAAATKKEQAGEEISCRDHAYLLEYCGVPCHSCA